MLKKTFLISALIIMSSYATNSYASPINTDSRINNIVLVHGAFADGSGWKGVFNILKSKGYNIWVVQEPETSLKADVAATNRIIDLQKGPVILVGHSYGGVVITQAGNNPKVKGLVYVSAVMPKAGENVLKLLGRDPLKTNQITPIGDGFTILNPKTFPEYFAGGVNKSEAEFMAYSQVQLAVPNALGVPVTKAAWNYKPSWYIYGSADKEISPKLERFMALRGKSKEVVEVKGGSHAMYITHPEDVAALIETASKQS
jgi:pimeloyl-ACP methyl ester carboxylesterase